MKRGGFLGVGSSDDSPLNMLVTESKEAIQPPLKRRSVSAAQPIPSVAAGC